MSCLDDVALQPTSGVNYGRHARYRPRDGQNAPFGAASMAMGTAYHNVPIEDLFVARSRGACLSRGVCAGRVLSRGRHYRLPGGLFKDVLRPPLRGRAPPGP